MTKRTNRSLHTVARVSDAANETLYRREYDTPCEALAADDMLAAHPLPPEWADGLRSDYSADYAGLHYDVLVYAAE